MRILGLTTAVLLLTGLLGASPATAADPAAGAPAVGTCYNLTAKQVEAPVFTDPAVDCATEHTSQVIAVPALPADMTWSSPVGDIAEAVAPECWRAVTKTTGSNMLLQARARYSFAWFFPTAEQQVAGARWVSCHLIITEDDALGPLSYPVVKLTKRMPDTVASCLTGRKLYTTCADTHAWRANHSFYAAGKITPRNVQKASDRGCPRHVTSRKWLGDPLPVTPRKFIVVCYSQTRR